MLVFHPEGIGHGEPVLEGSEKKVGWVSVISHIQTVLSVRLAPLFPCRVHNDSMWQTFVMLLPEQPSIVWYISTDG